jgi:hypothetical protein
MLEALVIVGLVICLVVVATVPWPSLLLAGVVTTAVGLVFGVATGFWYHVALRRALLAARALRPRWWLKPVPLHEHLDDRSRRRVLPWFYAGAAGFFVTVAGMALIVLSMTAGLWRSP